MDNITKLWPVNQLLDWLSKIETKFVRVKSNDLTVLIAILKLLTMNLWIAGHPLKK